MQEDRRKHAEFDKISKGYARCVLRLPWRSASRIHTTESIRSITLSFWEAIRKKRPVLRKNSLWPHRDTAHASSLLVRDISAGTNTAVMPRPPYSPDSAPQQLFSFPETEETHKRTSIFNRREHKTRIAQRTRGYTEKWLSEAMTGKSVGASVISEEGYFEWDNINIDKYI